MRKGAASRMECQGLDWASYPPSWAGLEGGGFHQTGGDVDADVGAALRKDGDGELGRQEGACRAWGTLHHFRTCRPIRHCH